MQEPLTLDPMKVVEAQQRRLNALLMENVQLEAAVEQLQGMLADEERTENPLLEVVADEATQD